MIKDKTIVESAGIHWKTSPFLNKLEKKQWKGKNRWMSNEGDRIYTWDSMHGEIEVFNKRGHALAILNPDGPIKEKAIEKGRTIKV